MQEQPGFAPAVAARLAYASGLPLDTLRPLVDHVLSYRTNDGDPPPDRAELQSLQNTIRSVLSEQHDRVVLVYGGATKVKEYVFEAPKLPEIRGASALLDWVNQVELPRLWSASSPDEFVEKGIIFASGGNILAFAPAEKGQRVAAEIEQCYTDWTLTANSAAVSQCFTLLELRYGRSPLAYWVEDFLEDWNDKTRRKILAPYYDFTEDADLEIARASFFQRKNFSELVTLLATRFYCCREERHNDPRSFYSLQPWDSRCQSSGTRPAVVLTQPIGDELAGREMSEASARKRFVGQVFKRDIDEDAERDPTRWFWDHFDWNRPAGVSSWRQWSQQPDMESWEQRWNRYLGTHPDSNYARVCAAKGTIPRPARDVHEIGGASARYIGIIYADGNRMGRFFSRRPTPDAYAAASNIIAGVLEDAVFDALATYLEPYHTPQRPAGDVHPFETLTIGGDDVLLIVPGNRALDIALHIGHTFESNEQIRTLTAPPSPSTPRTLHDRYAGKAIEARYDFAAYTPDLSLSTGVIIAQEHAPIFFLRELVEELLKSAKKKTRAQAEGSGGAVDFMVLKAVTMVTDNIAAFRERALDARSSRRLVARPYTWHELAGLLATARMLREVKIPRSQLYRLRGVLDQQRSPDEQPGGAGILASSLEYLYTRARMERPRASAVLEHVELSWRGQQAFHLGSTTVGSSVPPWLKLDNNTWETIWHDLVEIYDMLA